MKQESRRWLCFLLVVLSSATAQAGILIHFDQTEYDARVGQPLAVDLILDADDQSPGDQVLAQGLFSMRFRVTFDAQLAEVASVDDVLLPAVLDNDGFGGPPVKADNLGPGFVQIGAAIQDPFGADGLYMGEPGPGGQMRMRLATIRINPLAGGDFSLGVRLVRRSAGDDVFIDGVGRTIDDDLRVFDGDTLFDTAAVHVAVPEPSALASLLLLVVLTRRKNRCQ